MVVREFYKTSDKFAPPVICFKEPTDRERQTERDRERQTQTERQTQKERERDRQ